ncbi:MAG: ATP-binding cassette domain-containing protein [Alphaproteobacteria bacterium]|nr:ATP-binding cassette domain-containing protein [Alphaproteobacteria bacterium]
MLIIKNLTILPINVERLELKAGLTALAAPSGAGKSRLFAAIADLIVNEGEVSLDDVNRNDIAATHWRKMVRYVSAEPSWWGNTVAEHLSDDEKTRQMATKFGLTSELYERPIEQLSTGERQRFGLLRALVDEPQVLLLDEPTAALDQDTSLKIEAELVRLAGEGRIIFIISHSEAQIERIATRVVRIVDGKVCEGRK